jgi:UPF0176 protein
MSLQAGSVVVAALYKFVELDNYKELREPLLDFCIEQGVKGSLLLAREGLNGTVSGSRAAIDALLSYLRSDARLEDIDHKESLTYDQPFYRMKVKLKKEIVTMGVDWVDPKRSVGAYIEPSEWNALISDPDVVVVDTRNEYEIGIGTFQNAINPNTETFREFPAYVEQQLADKKDKKIAMFCTGGIRCEKSTAYLKEQGFDEVFHLKGGILKYLEEVPEEDSLWRGECFVFDNRVAVDHDLNKGSYDLCHACRMPISDQDKQHKDFVEGISCHNCVGTISEQQLARFEERQKQIALSKERGEQHIGSPAPARQKKPS